MGDPWIFPAKTRRRHAPSNLPAGAGPTPGMSRRAFAGVVGEAMGSRPELAVLTPSYGPDAELCRELNRSVLRWMPENVIHHIVVPGQDIPLFRMLLNSRTEIHEAGEFLPSSMWKAPGVNLWINRSHPWPPVRGWIAQQLIQLSASATLKADAVLLVDSDMVMVAPTDIESFRKDGLLEMYRNPGAIHSGLPRHRLWLESARALLGLDPPETGNLDGLHLLALRLGSRNRPRHA